MVISGVIATMATMPKASDKIFPPRATQVPMAKGRIKVEVKGPEATPPDSKAGGHQTSL